MFGKPLPKDIIGVPNESIAIVTVTIHFLGRKKVTGRLHYFASIRITFILLHYTFLHYLDKINNIKITISKVE
jgi:hypothetical protein